jgi:hypothetical protein
MSGAQRRRVWSFSTKVPSISGLMSTGMPASVAEKTTMASTDATYTRQYGFT